MDFVLYEINSAIGLRNYIVVSLLNVVNRKFSED